MRKYTITFKQVGTDPVRVVTIEAMTALSSGTQYILYADANRTQMIASYPTAKIDEIESVPA